MWFKFEKGKSKGKLRIKHVQAAWYDMERNGDCFDESFVFPSPEDESKTLANIGMILPYVETVEDESKPDRSRVFVHFNNDDVYELKMEKLSKEQIAKCSNFYGTKSNKSRVSRQFFKYVFSKFNATVNS